VLDLNRVYVFPRGIKVDYPGFIIAILAVEGDRSLAEYDAIKLSLEEKVKIKGAFVGVMEKIGRERKGFRIEGH
jgi:hypothetical protein